MATPSVLILRKGNDIGNAPDAQTYYGFINASGGLTLKDNVGGTVVLGDVSALAAAVDALESDLADLVTVVSGKANTSHTHAQSDITDLVTDLAGKAASSHTHTVSNITDFAEGVDDRVATLLTEGDGITLTYNDSTNTLEISASGGGSELATETGPAWNVYKDGSNQATVTRAVNLTAPPFSWAGRYRRDGTGGGDGDRSIFHMLYGGHSIFLRSNNDGGGLHIGFIDGSGEEGADISSSALTLNTWKLVTLSVDEDWHWTVSVDGTIRGTGTTTKRPNVFHTGASWIVGYDPGTYWEDFHGQVNHLCAFDYVLVAGQISLLWAGKNPRDLGAVAYVNNFPAGNDYDVEDLIDGEPWSVPNNAGAGNYTATAPTVYVSQFAALFDTPLTREFGGSGTNDRIQATRNFAASPNRFHGSGDNGSGGGTVPYIPIEKFWSYSHIYCPVTGDATVGDFAASGNVHKMIDGQKFTVEFHNIDTGQVTLTFSSAYDLGPLGTTLLLAPSERAVLGFVLDTTTGKYRALVPRSALAYAKCKLDATSAPGVGDDAADGYSKGSIVLDTTGPDVYFCADPTEGAAVWVQLN